MARGGLHAALQLGSKSTDISRLVAVSFMRILFCGNSFPGPEFLQPRLPHDELLVCGDQDIRSMLSGVDVVIPRMQRVGRPEMETGNFRLVQQWGAGLEGVDLEAAREKGISVANVPANGANAESVAEHGILLTLALLRDLPTAQINVRKGILGSPTGKMLAGRTVCLYGLGAIALPLAQRLKAFKVRLTGVTRDPSSPKLSAFGLDACFRVSERDQAFSEADVLILCTRYFPEMRGTIGMHELNCLPQGAYLVNIARGGLVDNRALHHALVSGRLAGAALDVFWEEPLPIDDPILALPNVITTPHIAGVTDESFSDIADGVAANIERLRTGQPLLSQVV